MDRRGISKRDLLPTGNEYLWPFLKSLKYNYLPGVYFCVLFEGCDADKRVGSFEEVTPTMLRDFTTYTCIRTPPRNAELIHKPGTAGAIGESKG